MAKMIKSFTLRSAPKAAKTDDAPTADAEDAVDVVDTQDDWVKVRLRPPKAGEGWVPKERVDVGAEVVDVIALADFAEQCVQDAVFVGVNAHLLMAAAHLRSGGIKDGRDQVDGKDRVGPYRLTADQWKAGIEDPAGDDDKFELGMAPADISLWRNQCTVVAVLMYRAVKKFDGGAEQKLPSAVDVFKAVWPDDKSTLPSDLQKSLDATADFIKKAAPEVLDDPPPDPNLPKATDPASPTNPKPGTASAPDTAAGSGIGTFDGLAPRIMKDLMAAFGLTDTQAAAILGNLGHESGGFRFMQEIKPISGKGGLGWAQWTGPRRRTFVAFCNGKGLPTDSYAGNLGYLKSELDPVRGSERKAIPAVKAAGSLPAMVNAFEEAFERAGIKALASREKFANRALSAFQSAPSAGSAGAGGAGGDRSVVDQHMNLSENFSLEEFTRSSTALALKLDNTPTAEHLANLKNLAAHMEKVRALFNLPIEITSGYRSPAVNNAVGGVPDSAHALGHAADFHVHGVTDLEAAKKIRDSNLDFDQLIFEKNRCVHFSVDPRMRRQVKRQPGGPGSNVFDGLEA